MRKPVLAVMTGLTALVVGMGVRAGNSPGTAAVAGSAGAGVLSVAPTTPSAGSTRGPAATSSSRTVNGSAVMTRFGAVQVQIVVAGKKIVSAQAIDYPMQDRRDQEINGYAIPQLNDEALQAQSSGIDTVSGATFTSDGYIGSLQSAIDQAGAAGLL